MDLWYTRITDTLESLTLLWLTKEFCKWLKILVVNYAAKVEEGGIWDDCRGLSWRAWQRCRDIGRVLSSPYTLQSTAVNLFWIVMVSERERQRVPCPLHLSLAQSGKSKLWFQLVDPASVYMLVSKTKPCMSKNNLVIAISPEGIRKWLIKSVVV